ncbi:class I SAM-dependent methyltransferase [Arenimonas fontis]|uniref:class I SAM-dependent methyltransferase n=1 Tax=Arenimonas fontis TaxID=2608255 RepID=UPI001661C39E|nr:class I SAM-dependent methyltransferase [Arenimonas fontis]
MFAGLAAGAKVLDLCCGNAPLSKMLLEERGDLRGLVHLEAVDAAEVAPAWVRALPPGQREMVRVHPGTDAAALPFPDACLDLCMSQFGIEYAGLQAWREAARVLRSGGELAAVLHHVDALPVQIAHEELEHLDWLERPDGLLPMTEAMIEPVARSADPAAAPALRADAAANASRRAFNACQEALRRRAASASHPDVLHEVGQASFVVLQTARAGGLAAGRAAMANLREELSRTRLRQRELVDAALDEAALRGLCACVGSTEPELQVLRFDGNRIAGWAIRIRR